MDESTQQIVALMIVAVAIVVELLRRHRRRNAGKPGCDGCDSGASKPKSGKEAPVRFYRRRELQ